MTAKSSQSIALITGAGSGIGRSIAIKLASCGWTVALTGRRVTSLQSVAQECGNNAFPFPCDIGDPKGVHDMVSRVFEQFQRIDALVNCAGMNIARRSLAMLSIEEYQQVLRTNLDGAFHCIHAVLPVMRTQRRGSIVNINSDAGLLASEKAGAAYVASKFGLHGLGQSINAEERKRGIRAITIFPGDVNTPLLDKRPVPPPAQARQAMVQPEDIAECVYLAITLPVRAIIEELVIRPA